MTDTCCHTECHPGDPVGQPQETKGDAGRVWRLTASALAIAGGLMAGASGFAGASLACYIAAVAVSIVPLANRAWRSLQARVLDINVLMVVAVVGAAVLGNWPEAAVVVLL